jgi:anti-sigma B factor antagonist
VQGLDINVDEPEGGDGIPVVRLKGEIDLHTCPELRATLSRLMEDGKHRIILDLAEVPYLDSAALGVLVDAVRKARENGGGIFLVQVTPFVQRAFEITRLIKIFQVHPSVEDARRAARELGDGS